MKTVHAEYVVKVLVLEGHAAYIALQGAAIGNACLAESVFGTVQHVLAIVQTGDVSLLYPFVFLCCKHGGTHGHIEQLTVEIIWNPIKHFAGNLVVVHSAPK